MPLGNHIVILAIALLSGCSVNRMVSMNYEANTIQARGFAAETEIEDANVYDDLSINLREAPPFIFVFPNGYRANSREITSELLVKHLAPLKQGTWGIVSGIGFEKRDELLDLFFTIGVDGYARNLWIRACNHSMPKLLGTPDGTQLFDFPIMERDLTKLFGVPERKLHFRMVFLDACRF